MIPTEKNKQKERSSYLDVFLKRMQKKYFSPILEYDFSDEIEIYNFVKELRSDLLQMEIITLNTNSPKAVLWKLNLLNFKMYQHDVSYQEIIELYLDLRK